MSNDHEQYDERLQHSRLMPLLRDIRDDDVNPTDGASVSIGEISDRLTLEQANSFAKDRSNVTVTHADKIRNTIHDFRENTEMLGQMNESYNANKYIKTALDVEHERIHKLHEQARREVYKAQQRHMSTHHRAQYNFFLARVFTYTLFVTMFVSLLFAAWMQDHLSLTTFIAISVLTLLIYAVMLTLFFNANTRRRQVHWKQYYWGTPQEKTEGCRNT